LDFRLTFKVEMIANFPFSIRVTLNYLFPRMRIIEKNNWSL
jgi:hypothetical protein